MNARLRVIPLALFIMLLGMFFAAGLMAGDKTKMQKHPDVDFSISCMECHTEVTPDAVKEWKSSKHGQMNFGCYMCHGDGQQEFYAHPGSERCTSCHPGKAVDFSKTKVQTCYDCHPGHALKFHPGD